MSHDSTQSTDAAGPGDHSRATPSVRPFGWVADAPVVRRLGDRDCFLGNAPAVASPECICNFDHVLSLTRASQPATTHHRPLTDDANNNWGRFAAAVDAARRLLARDGAVLIHCEAGVSRSSAVAAAALAAREDRQFVDALHEIQDYRVHAIPHPALHALGVQYVGASQ
jgi:atypical dual specificity phosphatase